LLSFRNTFYKIIQTVYRISTIVPCFGKTFGVGFSCNLIQVVSHAGEFTDAIHLFRREPLADETVSKRQPLFFVFQAANPPLKVPFSEDNFSNLFNVSIRIN
jgi:hypothetical protein